MKRQRGRGRKPGGGGGGGGNHGNHGNRSLESNGPEVKIRGTAAQIYEKYAQYARDAQSAGDRVKYENYLQHAEHYFRIMAATMPRDRMFPQQEGGAPGPQQGGEDRAQGEGGEVADPMKVVDEGGGGGDDGDYEGDEGDDGGREGEEVEASSNSGGNDDRQDGQQGDRQGRRRRRGRRRHHEGDRPGMNNQGGGAGGDANAGGNNNNGNGGDTEARSALDSLARKQGALAGG